MFDKIYRVGHYKNGKKEGLWKYYHYSEEGKIHKTGYYKDGKRTGKLTFYNGYGKISKSYNYENGEKHGEQLFFKNGVVWKKEIFKNGVLQETEKDTIGSQTLKQCPSSGRFDNCYGTYVWDDGEKYVGEWKNDRRNGKGVNTWAEGYKYDGEWKDDKRHGKGTDIHKSGEKYVGSLKNDQYWGYGVLYNPDGTIFTEGNFGGARAYRTARRKTSKNEVSTSNVNQSTEGTNVETVENVSKNKSSLFDRVDKKYGGEEEMTCSHYDGETFEIRKNGNFIVRFGQRLRIIEADEPNRRYIYEDPRGLSGKTMRMVDFKKKMLVRDINNNNDTSQRCF
jgi:hypothetical protein